MIHERSDPSTPGPSSWTGFLASLGAGVLAAALLAFVFVAGLDPYGLRAGPGRAPGPLMDLNQRFMYPQVVRGRRYDAAVFGTSTARLLDPTALDLAFGARFANLAMNAATPWEQVRIADLFLREVTPRATILSLDATWCEAAADANRLTFRAFPPWLYGPIGPDAYPRLMNLRGIEIAGRVALHGLGLMPERIRGDGYEVFVPPETAYDPARAARHLRPGEPDRTLPPEPPGMPALGWLEGLLGRMPAGATTILAMMPVHVTAQPSPGTPAAERDAACKARIAELGHRFGATVVDFRLASAVTREDSNYWDALHYRLPVAARIVAGLKQAHATGADDPEGFYRVLAKP